MATNEERLATLEANDSRRAEDIREVKEALGDLLRSVNGIELTLAQARGGWKVLAGMAGLSGVIGGLLVQVGHWAGVIPK